MNNQNPLLSAGLLTAAALLSPLTSARAQDLTAPQSALQALDWRVPIHSLPAEPGASAYGTWAAGRGYKISFHDGMCFYPVLGASAPQSLPVRWQTTRVRLGATELLDAGTPSSQHHDSWQFVYRSAGVSEVYDVRAEGVEQSFVIARPQQIDGDLEVIGRWTSPLAPRRDAVAGAGTASIAFVDHADREIVRYGAALAFDASGRRVDVATELEGDSIRLTVPAAWIRDARWPVTIDPLLTPRQLAAPGSTTVAIDHSDVAIAYGAATHRVMTTFSLPVSATDHDTYAVLTDANFQNPVTVFADIGGSYDTTHPRVAFVDQAGTSGRWTIAFERRSRRGTTALSRIGVWFHDGGNLTFQSGSMITLPLTTQGWDDRRPDIGGSRNDPYALLVYEKNLDVSQSVDDLTELHRVMVNADARSFGTPALLDTIAIVPLTSASDRANPSVNQTSDGSPLNWVVCYQQRGLPVTSWKIKARLISSSGSTSNPAVIVNSLTGEPSSIEPSVDGGNTRYGVAYLLADSTSATTGSKLAMTRFMWNSAASGPTVQWTSVLDTATAFGSVDTPRVVYDTNVGNWAVAYRKRWPLFGTPDRIQAVRVGFDGAVVESQSVYSTLSTDGAAPSVVFDLSNKRFLLAYGTAQASSPVFGRLWTYPSNALNVPYGTSCGGAFGALTTPLVGTEFFRVRLTGAMPNTAAVLFVAGQSTDIDLGVINMPSCRLLVGPSPIISLPATTDAAGDALLTIPFLTVSVDLYLQWAHISIGSNPLGLLTTEGMRSQIR